MRPGRRPVREDRQRPDGALTTILPTWYLIPFAIVAILGLVGGAVLDIYSSGLTLLTLGLKIPGGVPGLDGVICILGTAPRRGSPRTSCGPSWPSLIVVGVPVAAWCGVFLADLALRHQAYDETALYDPRGRYGSVNWVSIALVPSAPSSAGAW